MIRKSKREIERKVDEMDTTPTGEYPQLDSLALALAHEWEPVDADNNLYKRGDSDEVYHMPPEFRNLLDTMLDETQEAGLY